MTATESERAAIDGMAELMAAAKVARWKFKKAKLRLPAPLRRFFAKPPLGRPVYIRRSTSHSASESA